METLAFLLAVLMALGVIAEVFAHPTIPLALLVIFAVFARLSWVDR